MSQGVCELEQIPARPGYIVTRGTRSSMFCCTYCQRANECSTDRLRRTTEQAALEESGQARWSRDSVAPTLHSKMDEGTRSDRVLY